MLSATKVGGTVAAAVCADAPWGIDFPQLPLAGFHYVCEGSCWLRPYGADPIPLTAGDLVLLSAGAGHVMASDPSGPTLGFHELARNFGGSPAVVVELSGSGPRTRLVCGGYRLDAHSAHPMLRLPPLLWLKAARQRRDLSQTLQMLSTELTTQQPGTLTIVDRLVDVLFVQILRAWADGGDCDTPLGGHTGLAALRDPVTAAAVSLIHQYPGQAWSVSTLAREVGVSRATLSRRFTQLVGQPPSAYLTRWRLEITARQLRQTSHSIANIANSVGYTSEFALSRAFTRHRRITPSRYRAAHRRHENSEDPT